MTRRRGGKAAITAAVAGALPAPASPFGITGWAAKRFYQNDKGWWQRGADDGDADLWLCGPLDVTAETRDENGHSWGLLVAWLDRDGRAHEVPIPRHELTAEGREMRARLADGGLAMNSSKKAREAMVAFLAACMPERRARCVPMLGWHVIGGVSVFVSIKDVYGRAAEVVKFQPAEAMPDPFGAAGTLEGWRAEIAAPCVGNTRLLFAVSCAFAGPLLKLIGEQGGGFNLRGSSRIGKTTALRLPASAWGGTKDKGADGFCKPWRATDNGLEATAVVHSDSLLCLDEMSQVDPKLIGAIAYMLANGSGKMRSRRDGLQRPPVQFRVLFLSTGELGVAAANAEAGHDTKAGQEVRLVDLRAEANAGLGLFEQLHGSATAGAFAERLSEAAARQYGTAAPAYVEWLVTELARDSQAFETALRDRVDSIVQRLTGDLSDAGGQVRSVARRFALVAIAGELATEAGITGWQKGLAQDAVRVCFGDWLADRGISGSREDAQAITRVRDFVSRHGNARFEVWADPAPDDARQIDPEAVPPRGSPVMNRAGWRRWVRNDQGRPCWHYFLTPDAMREALGGLDLRSANRALAEAGFLVVGADGKSSRSLTPPGHPKCRLYEIASAIMSVDGNG